MQPVQPARLRMRLHNAHACAHVHAAATPTQHAHLSASSVLTVLQLTTSTPGRLACAASRRYASLSIRITRRAPTCCAQCAASRPTAAGGGQQAAGSSRRQAAPLRERVTAQALERTHNAHVHACTRDCAQHVRCSAASIACLLHAPHLALRPRWRPRRPAPPRPSAPRAMR